MIDVYKIKLDKIFSERLRDFFNKIWLNVGQHKAFQLRYYANTQAEKRIYRSHCDALINLHYRVKSEYENRRKKNPKLKEIWIFKLRTGIFDNQKRIDHFTGKKFDPKLIDKRNRRKGKSFKEGLQNYHWLKDRFQKVIFECKTCRKKLYSTGERLQHAKATNWTHNKVKDVQYPALIIHPNWTCPRCNTIYPASHVKKSKEISADKNDIFYCEFCDFSIQENRLKMIDPYRNGLEKSFRRICLNCLQYYTLSKTRWYAQGLLCPSCKEKAETRLKNLKKRKNTP